MRDEIDDYLHQGAAEGWGERTIDQYRKRLGSMDAYLRRLGREHANEVQAGDLDQYILYLLRRGTKMGTRAGIASSIRAFFRFLAEGGRILSNPARDIVLHDDDEIDLPEPPLEEHEVGELIDGLSLRSVLDLRNKLHLELLYGCGLRLDESIKLNISDMDLERRTVHVHGKGGRERIMPMMRGVMGALRDYLALRRSMLKGPDDGALLLSHRTGRRLDVATFRNWLTKLNRARGGKKRIHPHLFRHSIAVHLLRGGADIRHVQEFLGHSSLETTKIYLRLVPGRLKEDYEKAMPEIAVETPETR